MTTTPRTRIGIIAGSGPEAGIDLWAKVLAENRRRHGNAFRGDIDAPDVTIVSVPELGHSMALPATEDLVWRHLEAAATRLAEQVDVYAIACNTLYAFADRLRGLELPARLVSPVDAVTADAERRGVRTVALLGAGPVMELDSGGSPYADLRSTLDVEIPTDPDRLHQLILDTKVSGVATPMLNREFGAILADIDADIALLACTELPLLAPVDPRQELVDVTRLLAHELVNGDAR